MTFSDIAHQRLHNQRITGATFEKPDDAVAWLGAVQAQDYAGARWGLGLRLKDAVDEEIERAFNDGDILRTHLLRPTWHFVTPADIRWLLMLTAPRVHAVNAYMYRKLELDDAVFKRSNAALAKALRGGKQLTRDELRDLLRKSRIPVDAEMRMGYIMMRAELDGIVCSGPRRGKQFTYALLDERAPQALTLEREEALIELARRYFISRGPATVHDFAKWSGLTVTDARHGLEEVKSQLDREVIGKETYWFPASADSARKPSPTAHLLSIFDEYISGYKNRGAIVSKEHGEKLIARGNALTHVILIDGQIVGTWKRTIGKDAVVIDADLFVRLKKKEKEALSDAADRYGSFLKLPAVLQ